MILYIVEKVPVLASLVEYIYRDIDGDASCIKQLHTIFAIKRGVANTAVNRVW